MKIDKTNEEIAAHIQHSLEIDKHGLGERGEHQREALKRVAEHLIKNVGDEIVLPEGQHQDEHSGYLTQKQSDNFLVVSATGTGKTRILGGIMDGAEVPTLLLTPRKLLNKQMMDEFCDEMGISRDKVGLIDGEVKGAARKEALAKPYLISTMQSLSTLVDNSSGKHRLRPELGMRKMCLLDEAHTAQGPQISAILNDLKEEMILGGVTATEAGVSNTLFNGQAPIFNLDLVTAIEQGKLAKGVKTGVIDVKLDEDWVEQLTNTPLGQEYSRRALELFAKTPATIKAMAQFHLSHVDDEIGKVDRFPTLVFTEGVAAARQGAETFNEMAQASGSKARAGFVSGDMDKGTRDYMLESYRKGEISVLFNDRMLEMGYDLPEATVVYSLKPTQQRYVAEQQLGRVTRKEPKGYLEKYGTNKVALAINVRPQGVVPYLYGEVLGNRPSLYQSGMEPPPRSAGAGFGGGEETQLKLDDAEFHTNYDEMASIIAGSPRISFVPPLPDRDWLRADQAARKAGKAPLDKKFRKVWEKLVELATEKLTEKGGIVEVPLGNSIIQLGYFNALGKPTWYIHESSIAALTPHVSYAPSADQQQWLNMSKLSSALRIAPDNEKFKNFWSELLEKAGKKELGELGPTTIKIGKADIKVGFFRFHSQMAWAVHVDDVPAIAKHLGLTIDAPPLPESGWNAFKTTAKLMGTDTRNKPMRDAWEQLVQTADSTPLADDGTVKVPLGNQEIIMGKFKFNRGTTWFMSEESLPALATYLGRKLPDTTKSFVEALERKEKTITPQAILSQKSERGGWAKKAD